MTDSSLLLVTIGGETAAIETAVVKSVVELDAVIPVPCQPPHVEGLAALRSRAMAVIDSRRSLDLPAAHQTAQTERLAVVVEIDCFLYALIVDQVSDVIPFDQEVAVVRTVLEKGWAHASRGMVQTPSGPAQLLDPSRLIEGSRRARAA